MNILDNKKVIKKIDPQDTVSSTELLPKQLETSWRQVNQLPSHDVSNIKNIVFCGMGASVYGALVVKSLFATDLRYPSEVVTDYHLPEYVNKDSLVVLTSYSGTTEEVLSCAEEGKAKETHMIILTKGGKLAEFAKTNNIPSYIFDGVLNPAGVPRLGNGYTILGLMGLLHKAGVITVNEKKLTQAIAALQKNTEKIKQIARKDVEKVVNKVPVIFAAEHLSGNAQIFRNQFNETSKTFSSFYLVPDLNHHLMEGLQFPKNSNLFFILLDSPNYSAKIRLRMQLTQNVVTQNHQELHIYKTKGTNMYEDFLEVLSYGSYLTLYLALIYKQNPAVNPWVDYFKDELSK